MTTYYIRKSGNDGNDGLSLSTAWLTIGKVNTTVVQGDTVYVGGGDYSTETLYPVQGTVEGVITKYIGDTLGIYTGDAGFPLIKDCNALNYIGTKGYFWVEGFEITDWSFIERCYDITIIRCKIHEGLQSALTLGKLSVENCAINLDLTTGGLLISAYIDESTPGFIKVLNNTIHLLGYAYLVIDLLSYLSEDFPVTFCNNICIREDSDDSYLMSFRSTGDGFAYWNMNYNCYFQNGISKLVEWYMDEGPLYTAANLASWQAQTGQDPNSLEIDPLIDIDKYHLTADSPCIDVGTDLSSHDVTKDIDEENRPINLIYDIGCDEFSVYINVKQQTILSIAYIMFGEALTRDLFSFSRVTKVVPSFSLKTKDKTKTIMTDAKLKHMCDHILPSGRFTLNTCPRCLGNGYYFDIKFDAGGKVLTINKEEKLLQELIKIVLTSKGANSFHREYGSVVSDSVGTVQEVDFRKTKLKQAIIEAVLRLKYLQRDYVEKGYKLSLEELIDKISNIEIYEIENDPTMLGFKVQILTVRSEIMLLQGSISL